MDELDTLVSGITLYMRTKEYNIDLGKPTDLYVLFKIFFKNNSKISSF